MGLWKNLKRAVKSWFTGGETKASAPKIKAPTIHINTGNNNGNSTFLSTNRRELLNAVRGTATRQTTFRQTAKKQLPTARERYNKAKIEADKSAENSRLKLQERRQKFQYKSLADSIDSKRTGGLGAYLESERNKYKTPPVTSKKTPPKKADTRSEERKSYDKATHNKYNTETGTKEQRARARQRIKSGEYQSDPNVEKWEVKHHPIAASAARGALSGTTFGASEYLAQKSKARKESGAEEYYQKHKNKTAETVGEIAGSFASFGGTAGVSEKAAVKAGKAASKLAPKTTGKAMEVLAKGVGKERAAKIAKTVGTDIVQNATTGLLYDFNRASEEHEIGSSDWWKEMGKSAAFNAAITGGVAGVSTLRGGKKFAKEAAEELVDSKATKNILRGRLKEPMRISKGAQNNADEVAEAATKNVNNVIDDADVMATYKRNRLEESPQAVFDESNIKKEVPRKPTKNEQLRAQLQAEREALNDEYEIAKRTGGDVEGILTDMQETDLRIKDLDYKIEKANKAREAKATKAAKAVEGKQMTLDESVSGDKQMTLDDAIKASEEQKAQPSTPKEQKPPKTKEQIKVEKEEDKAFFKSLDELRGTSRRADTKMREQTGGDFGVRQSERTAAEHAPIDEAKRIKKEVDDVNNALDNNGVKEMFVDENAPFSLFKTANKEERRKVAESATARVNKDAKEVADRLFEKAERLKGDLLNNSALTSSEHVTLDEVADVIALRNRASSVGLKLPAKYEEAFSHIIEWQRTESAQMLKATDLFLKENDQNYRKMLLSRDMSNYLRKVLKADDRAIEDIKRSLDANNGEGYFDKMLDALSQFSGDKNEAAFRKAYADFQAEVFMNTKPTVWDTVNLWRHTLMLSSPKTGANNIIGNVLQRTMYNISDLANMVGETVARGIDDDVKRTTAFLKTNDQRRLARMFTSGKRGEHNIKNAKYLSGFADQEFADSINRVADADVGEMMASSKYMGEVVKGLKYKPTTAAGKVKQGANKLGGAISEKYVSTMLNEPDSWFVERNYRSALLKYLEANGVNSAETLSTEEGKKILSEARTFAKDVALENTYKKANNVVSFLEGIRTKGHTKGSNLGYKTASIVLDAELPYLKVPANLVINNFKYSPMGLFNTAVDAYKYVTTGDINALNKATRDLSKTLTGTGMAFLGYMMFCKDQADDNSSGFIGNAKDELKEYGVRDNSFKLGDKNFSIANMGIGSVQFLMGASLAEDLAEQDKAPSYQVVFDALSKTVDTVADMSLMENAVGLLDAFGNGGDYEATVSDRLGNAAAEIAGDYAAQFIANPLRGVAKGMTDADLDTGVKKGDTSKIQRALERGRNNFVQGIPIKNEEILPHRVDTHGNLINERKTKGEKAEAIANNLLNPLSPRKVNIPEADKEELKVKDENGKSFKPKGFDKNREYKAKIGTGEQREEVKLTGKEREQVARAAKNSGYDMAANLVKKGMFGDRLGDRAQSILNSIPDDEEKARELIFSTPEWQGASNEQKQKWLQSMYGEGQGNTGKGVARTQNAEAYINIAGNSEGDFRWQNDISSSYQKKYNEAGLADAGISKGAWVDILEACQDSNHKWNEETQKNQDTINSAWKTKQGILSIEGLTPEQRIAAYQTIRGKRNGFGWYDWDGISNGYSKRGYRRRGYRRRRGGSRKAAKVKTTSFSKNKYDAKMPSTKVPTSSSTSGKASYKSLAASLTPKSGSSVKYNTASVKSPYKTTATKKRKAVTPKASGTVKVTPPKVKFKKYEV